jgi:ribose 1,5-bisphosphokinase
VNGRLVYLMGASGVGKDSLLRYARERLAGTDILFAHRYITRPPVPGDENFIALSHDEFVARRELGLFAYAWSAHGCHYGIGREIDEWCRRGAVVVVSGSRAHYRDALVGDCLPIVITASPDILAARLAARGREDEIAQRTRLARTIATDEDGMVTIDNSGPLAVAGEALRDLLRKCRAETVLVR